MHFYRNGTDEWIDGSSSCMYRYLHHSSQTCGPGAHRVKKRMDPGVNKQGEVLRELHVFMYLYCLKILKKWTYICIDV